ncbi:MAG: phosphoglycerate mutase family protein [Actinomycetia bacterium]|nr:phosphoglycerate mutase family protein [Actinomycetes bacterium]
MLHIVRHGRTAANASGLLLGRADPVLDDLGRAQATAVAACLHDVDRVIASPLARAQETAAAFGRPVETDDRWIELDYGEWDGQPIGDVPAEAWATWRADIDFCPPGGERLSDLGRRVRAACADVVEAATSSNVVVVTHVSPVKAAVAWALGAGDEATWRMYVAPASISRIDFRDTRSVLVSFNEVGHLPQP